MHGAKGSIKNRIYQFRLIQIFLKRKKKRQEKKLLKRRKLEEERKKIYQEVFDMQESRHLKLSEAPLIFRKKEGIKVVIYPLNKKVDKVIEVHEKKRRVGIERKEEEKVKKELTHIAQKTEIIIKKVKKTEEKSLIKVEEKKKKIEENLLEITKLKNEYQTIMKKNPQAKDMMLVIEPLKKKKAMVSFLELKEAEKICKEELKRVENDLIQSSFVKSNIIDEQKNNEKVDIKSKEKNDNHEISINIFENKREEKKDNIQIDINFNRKKEIVQIEKQDLKEVSINENQNKRKQTDNVHYPNSIIIDGPIKKEIVVTAITGGTLVAFPALFKNVISLKTSDLKQDKKDNCVDNTKNESGNLKSEKTILENKDELNIKAKEEKLENEQEKKKLKLYRNKLEASKEAEILIQAELQRQKDYIKALNNKIKQLDVSVRIKYQFKGIHHLFNNILKFAIGVLTIPLSKKRILGTVVGLTLIGNGIRGIRNSFRSEENKIVYIELKDFSKAIYNEQIALLKTKSLLVDSLMQIKDLKSELEEQYYGKISFDEYDEMMNKLKGIESTLVSKQKEVMVLEESLVKAEEKNKVKVKQLEEVQSRRG